MKDYMPDHMTAFGHLESALKDNIYNCGQLASTYTGKTHLTFKQRGIMRQHLSVVEDDGH